MTAFIPPRGAALLRVDSRASGCNSTAFTTLRRLRRRAARTGWSGGNQSRPNKERTKIMTHQEIVLSHPVCAGTAADNCPSLQTLMRKFLAIAAGLSFLAASNSFGTVWQSDGT